MLGFRYKQKEDESSFGNPRNRTQLHFKFFGHEFTKEDKDNLLKKWKYGELLT
jgi:hypothetical protein